MSADSPRRLSRKGSTGHVVLPQPVSDPSIIESVAGFIHEVIPQAYSSVLPGDSRESIAWARFEQADYNDASLYPDGGEDCDSTPPLLLVLGYTNGVQVWSISSSGEAVEVLSWNQRVVRTLRFLPSPLPPSSSPHHLHSDPFAHKRPLIALVDNSGPPPHFSTCSFISLQAGDQVKSIKFKNPICDVLANRRSIVITFVERIAVFDALTLEDRLTITTCYPSPGVCPNPVALGSRWLAFADKRLVPWWRSVGGCDVDGAQGSYTASVLHAAKTLGKGLRGLSGHVASHLAGGGSLAGAATPHAATAAVNGDAAASAGHATPGVVTVVDIQGNISTSNQGGGGWSNGGGVAGGGALGENIVAHFVAHLEPIVALAFDPSGLLLLTVDKRGHRFHLFRIQPHLSGSTLSEVHQLYTLYRGDTTARIQDVAFSCDSRWVAVSSLRGTTHVFPITPYGGSIGVRTHTTPHVVNKLSRFHRSAGLSVESGCGRNSPVPHDGSSAASGPPLTPPLSLRGTAAAPAVQSHHHAAAAAAPVIVQPLAQLRRHYPPQSAAVGGSAAAANDSDAAQVRVAACFGVGRASLPPGLLMPTPVTSSVGVGVGGVGAVTAAGVKAPHRKADSIYVMSAPSGALVQYDVEPRHIAGLSKERISDDTAIELLVDAKAEWPLMSPPLFNPVQPPLSSANPLLQRRPPASAADDPPLHKGRPPPTHLDEHWLSQVEIVTHAGPHRRLWMGPQFTFKTYSLSSSDLDKDSVEVGTIPVQSNPINVPMRPPLLIESGSTSSLEQSPHLTEVYQNEFEFSLDHGESRLREDLADAMQESPSMPGRRWSAIECGVGGGQGRGQGQGQRRSATVVERRVNPLGTIIMVQSPKSAVPAPHQLARQPTEHLIVVAAESKRADDVTRPPTKTSIVSNNINNNRVEQVGDKLPVPKSTTANNKERRKNAKNERKSSNAEKSISDKSITSEKSISDKSMGDEKSINTSDKSKYVEKSFSDKSISDDKAISDKSISDDKSINTSDKSKNVVKSKNFGKSIDVDKSMNVEKSIDVGDRSIISVEKPTSVVKSKKAEITVDEEESMNLISEDVEKLIDVSVERSEEIVELTSDERSTTPEKSTFVDKSISVVELITGEDKSIVEIDCSGVDLLLEENAKQADPSSESNVGSRASKRRWKKKADGGGEGEKNEEKVEVCASDVQVLSASLIDKTAPPVESAEVKDREYPTLTSTLKTKRKCRTLGKKISKSVIADVDDVVKLPPPSDLDLLEESHHSLLDFPDLLLANVAKPVDKRRESIAQVVIESIEKDNLTEQQEEEEVKGGAGSSDKEETTDKDSSDDSTTSSKCEGGKGGGGGGGGGKKKKNRKKAGGGGEVLPSLGGSDVVEKCRVESVPVVKLSWSQIASKGTTTITVEEEEEEEEVIQPEIISWVKEEKEGKSATATAEDRGSVYESCCESVEDCGEQQPTQCLIEVVAAAAAECDTATAADDEQCRNCQSSSEGGSGGGSGGGKESSAGDSGEKEAVAKKSRKQRKKRR